MNDMIITGDYLITMDMKNRIIRNGALYIEQGIIKDLGTKKDIIANYDAQVVIDEPHKIVAPGFIQAHTHSVQTIFRGLADDLSLLDWLKKRILPLEAAIDKETSYYSSMLGFIEMIRTGTTSCLDMLTVNFANEGISAARDIGIRTRIGKMLMDMGGDGVPETLIEDTDDALEDSIKLLEKWHNYDHGRIKYVFNPRFALSCTEKLFKNVRSLTNEYNDLFIHTHASENLEEVATVRKLTHKSNIEYLHSLGITGKDVTLAHGIWVEEHEYQILKETQTNVCHCPSSNSKLGSGVCDVLKYLNLNIPIALGADGAPCNNNLSMFQEMKTAAFLQKATRKDPKALKAPNILNMVWKNGARALGMQHSIGSLEKGKKADIVVLDYNHIFTTPFFDPISAIVYSMQPSNVYAVIIDGKLVFKENKFLTIDETVILKKANKLAQKLKEKVLGF